MAKKTIRVSNSSWKGTSKKDKVYIDYADYVKVSTGGGNDSIYNDLGYYATIDAGTGNDTITLYYGKASYVNAGAGNDRVSLYGGSDITVTGGTGNDTVYGNGYKTLYRYAAGDGNDVIFNWSESDTLKITGGKYTKKTSGDDVILTVGSGKITLKGAKGKSFTIKGTLDGGGKNINNTIASKILSGTGYADTIKNSANYVTISGGAGNDKIDNTNGVYSSINAGDGNDSIHHISYDRKGHYVTIIGGEGKDTIINQNGDHASINAGSGNDSIYDGSWYSTLNGGTGNDTITTDGDTVTVYAGDGDDSLNNKGNYAVLSLGDGNDTIHNWGGNVSISGGAGKDFISTSQGKKITVNSGSGNDTILNWNTSDNAVINASSGNDSIKNLGISVTISGGTGNDTLEDYGTNTLYKYANGDGNDVIFNWSESDTLKITGGKYTKKTSGKDVILTVGSGKITLKGAKGKKLNIDGILGGKLSIPSGAYTYNGHSYYIFKNKNTWEDAKTYCESRGGHLAVINNAAENSKLFNYMKSKGYDSAYFGLSDAAKEGTWTWATGDSSSYRNWASGEPNGGTYENYGMFYYKFTNGTWNDGDFGSEGINTFICEWDTVTTGGGTSTVTVPSGDLLKGTSGHDDLENGSSLNRSRDAGKVIYAYGGNDTVTNYADNVYISGGSGNDYIKSLYGSNSTVHGDAGTDNITVKSNNALIYGDDDNDRILTYREGNFVYGGKGNDYIYTEHNNNGFVSGDAGDDTITAYKGTHLTLSGGAGNDSLWGGPESDTLIGGSGNDIFVYKPGEGTDHITDFSGGDMLKILNTNGSEGGSFTSATFSGGSLTLEISGGGTVILDNVSTGDKININGTKRTISSSTLK